MKSFYESLMVVEHSYLSSINIEFFWKFLSKTLLRIMLFGENQKAGCLPCRV